MSSYNDYDDHTLQSKYTALEKQNRSLKELASDQTLQISKLVQEKGEAENQVYDIQAKATRYQHEIQELRRDNERLRSGGHNSGTIGNNNDNRELEELNKKYLALTLSSSKFEAEARDYEQIIEAFKANKDELIEKIEGLEGQVRELKAKEFKDKQQAYHESQTTNVQNNQETQELQRQVAQLKAEKQDLQGQVAELQWKAKQAQQKEASGSNLLANQELQRYKDYSAQMRSEIEQATKTLNNYRHGTNSGFIDHILLIFKSLQQPPPSSPSPTVPHAGHSPHSTPPGYPPTYSAGGSTHAPGNPPYYPSTPASPSYGSPNYMSAAYNQNQYNAQSIYSPSSGVGYPYTGGSGAGAGAGLGSSMRVSGGSSPVIKPIPSFAIPAFCARNVSDLPDIIDVLNEEGKNSKPILKFKLEDYAKVPDGGNGKLAVVLAMCGTDRVDITDKELLDNLRETKGYTDVLMVVLRRGNEPSKFKAYHDPSINSGVEKEKMLFQLLYFKGKLVEAECNTSTIARFFELAKKAFPAV